MKQIVFVIMFLIPMVVLAQSKQSDEYYSKGVELYNAGKFKEAIPYFEKSNKLDQKELKHSGRRYYSVRWLASCYYKLGDEAKAAKLFPDEEYLLPPVDRRLMVEVDSLNSLVWILVDEGDYQTAIKHIERMIEIEKAVEGENHPWLANDYHYMGYCKNQIGESDTAEKFYNLFLEIYETSYGVHSKSFANALFNSYYEFYSTHNYTTKTVNIGTRIETVYKDITTKTVNIGTRIETVYKDIYGENRHYVNFLKDFADYLHKQANRISVSTKHFYEYSEQKTKYQTAINLCTHAMEIRKKVFGEKNSDYDASLYNLAYYYSSIGNYSEAIRLGTQELEVCKKLHGIKSPDYARSLNQLAGYNSNLGNYQEARRLCTQAMEIRRKVLGEEHPDYASSLHNLAVFNYHLGYYQEAIRLCTQAMEIRKKVLGENNPDYASSLHELAGFNDHLGNYHEAIRLWTQAMEIYKNVFGEEHPDYASSLNYLAGCNYELGNYQEAIRLGTEAMEIRKKALGEEHPDYAVALNNLALYNDALGNYSEAVRLGTEAMIIQKKVLGEEHSDYALSLHNLASYNYHFGNYQEAIRLGTKAMEIRKKALGEEHPDYAVALSNLAEYNAYIGDYDEAIKLSTQAMAIYKNVFGEEHHYYVNSLKHLMKYNFNSGKYEKATELVRQTYRHKESLILKTFSYLTYKERSDFWNMHSNFFVNELPLIAYLEPNSTLKCFAYNGQLLSKGLNLNAELEIQKLIEKQGNAKVKDMYYKIRQDRKKLDELYQLPLNKRPMDADSLSKAIDKEERFLVESCQEIGDYTKNLSIKLDDIHKELNDNDIAIEFANFNYNDTVTYIALILKKGMSAPELVKLDYKESDSTDIYTTPKLYNSIWQPLKKYLDGVKNVYFSPCGKFHTIAIEYLPDESGEIFAKKYNAYRLSSTRELALEKKSNPNKKAAVYGGIQYNFGKGNWEDMKNNQNESEHVFRDYPLVNSENFRSGVQSLKGTKIEAEAIANTLRAANYVVSEMSGTAATEESFKNLSGSGISILHIGTHGFYQQEDTVIHTFLPLLTNDRQSTEDLSLSKNGLLLAGANTALAPEKRKQIPDGVEDGILTAKEISRLDFKGLDLVVLSACETGLGKITGDGVFGLQRGFKKAGAQTIVMSLWKVADDATQLLMTEFFKNLTSGKSKRESFISAQNTVKEKYPDPMYWAAFIMVDDI